ncbi:hypothetical protein ASG82_12955 [Mycobacterium sp. Soil538]|nr:hypothetical protein ASG82_12955 [Mycobacterium sp. Soil538]
MRVLEKKAAEELDSSSAGTEMFWRCSRYSRWRLALHWDSRRRCRVGLYKLEPMCQRESSALKRTNRARESPH